MVKPRLMILLAAMVFSKTTVNARVIAALGEMPGSAPVIIVTIFTPLQPN
jgi:hypothetical protein